MYKFTPGPWRVTALTDKAKYDLPFGPTFMVLAHYRQYPSTVCVIEPVQEIPFKLDRNADAHLIAAAPDLLQALTGLMHVFESNLIAVDDEVDVAHIVEMAKSAIYKATNVNPIEILGEK